MTAAYCVDCGERLEERESFGRLRGVCPRCGHVHFDDPKVAVGVVVEMDGRIVLGQRNHEPMRERWSFPSGFVEMGERLEEAAVREVEEETGLQVALDRLLGAYSGAGERTVFIAYAGHVIGGRIEPGEECIDVVAFAPAELPPLAFPHDAAIVEAWSAGTGIALNQTRTPG